MRGSPKTFPAVFASLLVLLAAPLASHGQELKLQPTPFTAWLDFRSLTNPEASAAARRAWPIWLESLEAHAQKSPATGEVEKTLFRLRFRRFARLNDELLLRLFFQDTAQHPVISAWTEIGAQVIAPKLLGQGIGLPVSETELIPMANVDYLDIEVPGDGATVQGAFISSVQKTETRQTLDLAATPALTDPFSAAPAAVPGGDDALLFGRVKATLDGGTVTLSRDINGGSNTWEFELESAPLLAVVSFEILHADVTAPPEISVNDRSLGAATPILPDLADPAYEGDLQPSRTTFHYNGWLKCQKVLSGAAALRAGLNRLQIQTANRSDAVAVRAVEVQLKYTLDANAR